MTPKKLKKVKVHALVGINSGEVYEVWLGDEFAKKIAELRSASSWSFFDRKVEVVEATLTYPDIKVKK